MSAFGMMLNWYSLLLVTVTSDTINPSNVYPEMVSGNTNVNVNVNVISIAHYIYLCSASSQKAPLMRSNAKCPDCVASSPSVTRAAECWLLVAVNQMSSPRVIISRFCYGLMTFLTAPGETDSTNCTCMCMKASRCYPR